MVYTPTKNIITARAIPENLLTYCIDATRQAAALTWAGGTGYKLIRKFSNSVANRAVPVYPSIAFSDDNDAQDANEDIIMAVYTCTFELSIQNHNPDTAVTQARVYAKAFCSMMVNCPAATLGANTGGDEHSTQIQTIETGFDPIKTNEQQNDFLQTFQIRITVSLFGAAFN